MQTALTYPFQFPELAFDYNALEPFIDETTMHLHHEKHHQSYIVELNEAIKDYPLLHELSIEALLRKLDTAVPERIRLVVKNQGGGHANHQMFWKVIRPPGVSGAGSDPSNALARDVTSTFGSLDNFKKEFEKTAVNLFGSGWVFLVYDSNDRRLKVHSTANQDSVLLETGLGAIFGNDVWEHAYYLKYNNGRAEYLHAWWSVLAWDIADERYTGLKNGTLGK